MKLKVFRAPSNNQGVIRFWPSGIFAPVANHATVLAAGLAAGLEIDHSCGGMGTCGTCRVWVEKGSEPPPPRNSIEGELAEMRSFAEAERLACQLPAMPGLQLRIPGDAD